MLRHMSDIWLHFTFNKLDVEGLENIDTKKPMVIVGNHTSTLDMFTCMSGIPVVFRALGKEELENYPLLNIIFRTLVIFIDRSDPTSRSKGVEKCRETLKKGISIFIMPEGTRNRSQAPLLPFKDGAFRLAIELQVPLQPFVLLDCRLVYPMWSWVMLRPGKMTIKFLPPIEVSELTLNDLEMLKNQVWQQMQEVIIQEDRYYSSSK